VRTTSRLRIVVTGLIGGYPLGGMAWHYLQYVLGLANLGHDVFYVEDSGRDPYDPIEGTPSGLCAFNVEYLNRVMSRFAMSERWAYRRSRQSPWFGMSDRVRSAVLQSADLLINVSGSLENPEEYRMVRRLVYVDTDPVFTQLKLARGQETFLARVNAHDVHFSFGARLSEAVPRTGHVWRATRQPILLQAWRQGTPRRHAYTTIMSWTSYKSQTYRGRVYGHKNVEFMRFVDLPRMVAPTVLEVASARGRTRPMPRNLLNEKGWQVVDPDAICPDLDSYRDYVESSKGEWSVAKNAYVQTRCGWFSERSACYLAAGRPVIVQDTGFSRLLPCGEGIVPFTTIEEAASAIREVEGNYPRHTAAARSIAEECFDSDKVLTRLIEDALSDGALSIASSGISSGSDASA
jgi:hypothetical protein